MNDIQPMSLNIVPAIAVIITCVTYLSVITAWSWPPNLEVNFKFPLMLIKCSHSIKMTRTAK